MTMTLSICTTNLAEAAAHMSSGPVSALAAAHLLAQLSDQPSHRVSEQQLAAPSERLQAESQAAPRDMKQPKL
jgi:hypothetical protein